MLGLLSLALSAPIEANASSQRCSDIFSHALTDPATLVSPADFDRSAQQISERNDNSFFEGANSFGGKDDGTHFAPTKRPYPKSLLKEVWRKQGLFRQKEFFAAFHEDPALVQQIFSYWYPAELEAFQLLKASLPKRFVALALDPGIISRAESFLFFVSDYLERHPGVSLVALRNAYSAKLGTQKAYRALALNQGALDLILREGISPRAMSFEPFKDGPYLPNVTGAETRLKAELSEWNSFLTRGTYANAKDRIHSGGVNFLQSITSYPEVGIFAASKFGKKKLPIYVFELEIPTLDVTTTEQIGGVANPTEFIADGKSFKLGDPGVENFVFGKIERSWIKDVRHIK